MGEITGGLAVEAYAFDTKPFEKTRHDDTSHGVDRVKDHFELGFLDGFHINVRTRNDGVQVLLGVVMFRHLSQFVHSGEIEFTLGGQVEYRPSFGGGQEFPVAIEQFKGIPLAGVMGSSDDDPSVSLRESHRHFGCGRRGQSDTDHIDSAGD